jgi:hypothetical protein
MSELFEEANACPCTCERGGLSQILFHNPYCHKRLAYKHAFDEFMPILAEIRAARSERSAIIEALDKEADYDLDVRAVHGLLRAIEIIKARNGE